MNLNASQEMRKMIFEELPIQIAEKVGEVKVDVFSVGVFSYANIFLHVLNRDEVKILF